MSVNSEFYSMRETRTKWFREARFGMFIHWGLYAIPARGEWVRSVEKISIEDYQQYFEEFNPVRYDPAEWARAAKEAGMKYAVLTAKHHDGFCLFDSKLTDYKAPNTPCGRDLVKEFAEAFRKEGIAVGFYYSLVDWHHEDYPAYRDRQHPMRDNEEYKNTKHNLPGYIDYMHGQVEELLTSYGKIDIMWFDFSYHNMTGETWRATELVKMIRTLQPHIIIDNRLGGDIKSRNPELYAGDFGNPEQIIPREGMKDEDGNPIPWEANITLNNNWGYCANDKEYKSPKDVIRTLINCVSKDGNLLVNVGPNAKGEIPEESLNLLHDIGKWMRKNGESIYGCGSSNYPKPEWGRFTQKGKILYAHILDRVIGQISLQGLRGKIKKARLLSDGSEVLLSGFWNAEVDIHDNPEDIFINFGIPVQFTYRLPDDTDTVIELELLE
jgi:alpha-L-fucosidase